MAIQDSITVYGIPYDPERDASHKEQNYLYLKALIEAEKINPEPDYDGQRILKLLKKVANADVTMPRRDELVKSLDIKDYEEDDYE